MFGVDVIKNTVKTLPQTPGVYRMLDEKGVVLYVGKAKNLKNRVVAYTQPDQLPIRLQRMVFLTSSMEIVHCKTEIETLLLEATLIKKFSPKYNVLLKDDKAFPHIYIQRGHNFPQLYKKRGVNNEASYKFGPYATIDAVEETLITLQKVFQIRSCSDSTFDQRTRPCLNYHIRRCSAPCVGKISKQKYSEDIQNAVDFLNGKSSSVQKRIEQKMKEAATLEQYEVAAKFRDQIRSLNKIQSHASIAKITVKNADLIAIIEQGGKTCVVIFFVRNSQHFGSASFFPKHQDGVYVEQVLHQFMVQYYTNHEAPTEIFTNTQLEESDLLAAALTEVHKKRVSIHSPSKGAIKHLLKEVEENAKISLERKLLEKESQEVLLKKLAEFLNMEALPKRIEIYDNSHMQGTHSVGAMVVAGEEGFIKSAYRKFNIKDEKVFQDDFGMMKEVMHRRFLKISEGEKWTIPDVVIIDGGLGQLGAVEAVLNDINLPIKPSVISISKGPDRNAGKEKIHRTGFPVVELEFNDPLLFYLQRLRDEAHRFAIETHRTKRAKAISVSKLDEIPNIGAQRKKALLKHFGSVKDVRGASVSDLERVEGISPTLAKKIYEYFR